MEPRGDLHLIKRKEHVTRLPDGTWVSGYWELSDFERSPAKRVYLHRTKADPAHFGGDVLGIVPASDFADLAARHATPTEGRCVLVVQPDARAKGAGWEGADYQMAYKSIV
jgi:hypothetical protein